MNKNYLQLLFYGVFCCLLSSCKPKELNFFKGTIDESFKEAKKEDKYLFVISSVEDCPSCNSYFDFLNREYVVKKEIGNDFILYKNSIKFLDTEYFQKIFYNVGSPTTYLFSSNGELKDIIVGHKNPRETISIIQDVKEGIVKERDYHQRLQTNGKALISFYNDILFAWRIYNNKHADTEELKEAIQKIHTSLIKESYFYNNYLAAMLYRRLGDPNQSKLYAAAALTFTKSFDISLYQSLRNDLKSIVNENYNPSDDPYITFKATDYNYGIVMVKSRPKAKLEFKNTGKAPLIITSVIGNCSCMDIEWQKKPISPGKTGNLEITYHADYLGPFSKAIFVTTSAYNAHVTIKVKGTVKGTQL